MGIWGFLMTILRHGSWDKDPLVFRGTVGSSSGVHTVRLEWSTAESLSTMRDKRHASVGDFTHCRQGGRSGIRNVSCVTGPWNVHYGHGNEGWRS